MTSLGDLCIRRVWLYETNRREHLDGRRSVLSVGEKFVYIIHEFDALSVHIQVKGFTKFGDLEDVFDVFIRNNTSLFQTYPSFMVIKDATIIKLNRARAVLNNYPLFYKL